MALETSEVKEDTPTKEVLDNEYKSDVIPCAPEGVTLATLNDQNVKYWNNK